jgi:hypothetical protein
MSIKRFVADKDTTITNAFKENLISRGTDANMGAADSLEVFSIYGQATTSSLEKSRILVQFPISDLISDRAAGKIPASGSVSFYLRLFNVEHPFSVPRDFTMSINPVSKSWEEGYGLDMEGYTDKGFVSSSGGIGTTWIMAGSGAFWDTQGGDVITGSGYDLTASFQSGLENIELDITSITEQWISGTLPNNGLMVKLSSSFEDGSTLGSFYTKKFSARGSEFYFNRPCIEARWNPSVTDDRNNFYASSSLLSAEDNIMNLYFYNKVGGKLKNIVNNPSLTVELYTNSSLTNIITASYTSVTNPLPGIYKAQIAVSTTASVLYDKWVNSLTSSTKYFSSSFDVYQRENDTVSNLPEYVVHVTNLKSIYNQNEQARFNVFVRERDWQPNIYTVAYNNVENTAIPNLYYKIFRLNDNYTIIDYSTGSLAYTKTSYDSNGNYFELDMNILEKDYGYGIKLATWDGNSLQEFKDTYKFRIE